jgi:hypothetical protein
VPKAQCIPCAICDEYATVNNEERIRKRRQILQRFGGGLRHRHRGVSNPPGRPRDRTGRTIGGLLTPPLHQ